MTDKPSSRDRNWRLTAESIDELFRNAIDMKGAAAVVEVVDQICTLSRYAPWNAMMITTQRPGAMAVASAREWRESFAREIIPGSRPIVILQTFGPIRYVYDLSDTYGPDHPRLRLSDPFAVKGAGQHVVSDGDLKTIFERLKREYHIVARREDYGSRMAGQAVVLDAHGQANVVGGKDAKTAFIVRIAKRQTPPDAFATLAHELAHIFCGHLGAPMLWDAKKKTRTKVAPWPDRCGILTVSQIEFEAEATSYTVCRRLGIETKSAEYLADYIREEDKARISVAMIVRAASMIEGLISDKLRAGACAPSTSVLSQK